MTDQNSKGFKNINLLILEEYIFISDILTLMLKNFGIQNVHKTTTLLDAKQTCESTLQAGNDKAIDIAIIDLIPPNNYGFRFMEWVRTHKSPAIQYMPVIFTTNDARKKIIVNGRDTGANEILIKPFTAYNISRRLLTIINSPRPFIKSPTYNGPNRRRRNLPFDGPDRRILNQEDIEVKYEQHSA